MGEDDREGAAPAALQGERARDVEPLVPAGRGCVVGGDAAAGEGAAEHAPSTVQGEGAAGDRHGLAVSKRVVADDGPPCAGSGPCAAPPNRPSTSVAAYSRPRTWIVAVGAAAAGDADRSRAASTVDTTVTPRLTRTPPPPVPSP